MTGSRHILVGAFFVLVLSILGYFTLFMTEFSLFKDSYPLVVHFSDANGLRQGDPVLIAGIRKGRVLDLVFDPAAPLERRITVNLKIDEPVELRDGFRISIEDATLLGGKQIYIDPGPSAGGIVSSEAPLLGSVSGNALAGIGDVIEENREAFARIISGFDLIVTDVRAERGVVGRLISNETLAASFTSGVEGFRTTVDNTALISQDLRDGKGTLGKLLTDDDLAAKLDEIGDRLVEISQDLAEVSSDVNDGKGAIGKLLRDEATEANVTAALEDIREIAGKINSGEGTLGRLIVDDTIANEFEGIVTKLNGGEGTLGKLLTEEQIYDRLTEIADNLAETSIALNTGQGTLGRLINDDKLYVEVEKAIGIVTRSLEEYREAAPITTFTSVLFGGF